MDRLKAIKLLENVDGDKIRMEAHELVVEWEEDNNSCYENFLISKFSLTVPIVVIIIHLLLSGTC